RRRFADKIATEIEHSHIELRWHAIDPSAKTSGIDCCRKELRPAFARPALSEIFEPSGRGKLWHPDDVGVHEVIGCLAAEKRSGVRILARVCGGRAFDQIDLDIG